MGLISLGAGVAIGYVLGSKNGKEKLDRRLGSVKKSAEETWQDPKVQDFVHKASETATRVAHDVAESAKKAAALASETVNKGSETVAESAEAAEVKVEEAAEEYATAETKTTGRSDGHSGSTSNSEGRDTDNWTNEGGAKS